MSESEELKAKEKLAKLVKNIDCCMLTTIDAEGELRSRPMSLNGNLDENGDLWFFTYGTSHKVFEATEHRQVNVSFSDIKKNNYASISGKASLITDKDKIKDLWSEELKAWFPQGVDTPDIALLKIEGSKAEYWNAPNQIVAHALALASALTGQQAQIGENEKLAM